MTLYLITANSITGAPADEIRDRVDLSYRNLAGIDLKGAHLNQSDLSHAVFIQSD
ncbi:MAG TPA: pentapeptide repeat-containing protein, partial [Methanothrix soehngenii]|nr:pentapeptide repeat-containing protein [Methanothrix soehngenii]